MLHQESRGGVFNCFICAEGSQGHFYRRIDICVEFFKMSCCLQIEGKQAGGIKRDILGREFNVRKGIEA